MDERPLAVRRKRRNPSGLINLVTQDATSQPTNEELTTDNPPHDPPKTPGNRKKRIRFSEPLETIAHASTGLTPALNRTKLLPASATEAARKRLSLPTQLMTPAASPQPSQFPPTQLSTTVQFAPLRQAIDPRMMRRLRRNHIAEEVNEVYAGRRKSKLALEQEVETLRKELALVRKRTDRASGEPEAISVNDGRIAELENELVNLKQEMRERSATMDTSLPRYAYEDVTMADGNLANADEDAAERIVALEDDNTATTGVDQTRSSTRVAEAAIQVDLPSPSLSDICRSARLSFEYLFPGENILGLEVSDPQPLIEAMITRAEKLKAELAQVEKKIAVSETSSSNMGRNFKDVLTRLDCARGQLNALKGEYETEKERARTNELEASTMEARWENADQQRLEAEQQRNEYLRSIERLQPALEYYQHEVKELTQTIMDLESSHEAALKDLRAELAEDTDATLACQQLAFEEAKSDLEAHVTAETTGRRKAEGSAVERLRCIKELENRQAELQSAVHEKQSIIRDLESEIEATKSGHEKEVGQLNVRIGQLVSDLSSAKTELSATRNEVSRLANLVQQEKAAGLKAVEAMRSEVKRCSNSVDAVKDEHIEGVKKRGEEVAQSFGLMTPVVEGGKYRDAEADEKVEGHVQLVRGKKRRERPDSGVEVWGSIVEEEVEEVVVETDVLMAG